MIPAWCVAYYSPSLLPPSPLLPPSFASLPPLPPCLRLIISSLVQQFKKQKQVTSLVKLLLVLEFLSLSLHTLSLKLVSHLIKLSPLLVKRFSLVKLTSLLLVVLTLSLIHQLNSLNLFVSVFFKHKKS
jgi:hypothetical protein